MPFFGWNARYRVRYEWLISITKEIIGLKKSGLPFWIYEQKNIYQTLETENERLKTRNERLKYRNERLKYRNERLKYRNERLKYRNERLKTTN